MKMVLTGEIVSDKMDKTKVIKVERIQKHKIYQKNFLVSKLYKAHDQENQFKNGDIVEFVQCRPYSKDTSHIILRKAKHD